MTTNFPPFAFIVSKIAGPAAAVVLILAWLVWRVSRDVAANYQLVGRAQRLQGEIRATVTRARPRDR